MGTTDDILQQDIEDDSGFSKDIKSKAVVNKLTAIDIKNIRAKFGMNQGEFASAFGINVGTLRHWERGDRSPNGSALVLLNVVKIEPQAVLNALRKCV